MSEGAQIATAMAASDISTAVLVAEHLVLTQTGFACSLGGMFAVLFTHKWVQRKHFQRHMITVT